MAAGHRPRRGGDHITRGSGAGRRGGDRVASVVVGVEGVVGIVVVGGLSAGHSPTPLPPPPPPPHPRRGVEIVVILTRAPPPSPPAPPRPPSVWGRGGLGR